MSNHPFIEIVRSAIKIIGPNALIFQKFTCAGCGKRLGIEEPNKLFTKGCCEHCNTITDIKKDGCNYLLHLFSGPISKMEEIYGPIPKQLIIVEVPDGKTESRKEGGMEDTPPPGASS